MELRAVLLCVKKAEIESLIQYSVSGFTTNIHEVKRNSWSFVGNFKSDLPTFLKNGYELWETHEW